LDVTYKQTLTIVAGATPDSPNQPVTKKDFELQPAEITNVIDLMETDVQRFILPPAASNVAFCIGTMTTIKIFYIRPESDVLVKLVNSSGTSQNILFRANTSSILHAELTGLTMTNPSGSLPVKGRIFVAGE
jgi:hypothetical protein